MTSAVTIRGRLARTYADYRDIQGDVEPRFRGVYREQVIRQPDRIDIATIAIVLKGTVRFTPGGKQAVLDALPAISERWGEDGDVVFDQLRSGITATDDGKRVIAALTDAQRISVLARAIVLVFIEAHPSRVEVERDEGDIREIDEESDPHLVPTTEDVEPAADEEEPDDDDR